MMEMILVLIVLGIVAGVAAQPLMQMLNATLTARVLSDTQNDVSAALDRMVRDVRQAEAGAVSCPDNNTLTTADHTYNVSSERLRMDGTVLAGDAKNPIAAFECAQDAHGVTNLFRLRIETDKGYEGTSYVHPRN